MLCRMTKRVVFLRVSQPCEFPVSNKRPPLRFQKEILLAPRALHGVVAVQILFKVMDNNATVSQDHPRQRKLRVQISLQWATYWCIMQT